MDPPYHLPMLPWPQNYSPGRILASDILRQLPQIEPRVAACRFNLQSCDQIAGQIRRSRASTFATPPWTADSLSSLGGLRGHQERVILVRDSENYSGAQLKKILFHLRNYSVGDLTFSSALPTPQPHGAVTSLPRPNNSFVLDAYKRDISLVLILASECHVVPLVISFDRRTG